MTITVKARPSTSTAYDISASLMVLDLVSLRESPSNPRKTFLEIEELAADIKKRGLLQPVLARPMSDGHELVFGHRRYRASKLAGVPTILAIVREMDDCEVLETQLVENGKRADIHPLEEAEGYEQLHTKHAKTVEDIVALTGKSKAYVYARMKLLALCPAARKAFYAGEISASVALILARIPHEDLQKQAMKELLPTATRWDANPEPASARKAAEIVQQKFMLRLVDAPFDITDAKLVLAAGACPACPKRTGNQAELFADVDSADVCTDTKCFGKKRDAEWKRRMVAAEEKGVTVVEGKAAAKLFHFGNVAYDSKLVDLDKRQYLGDKEVTPRKLLKGEDLKVTLARDPEGGIHELVSRDVVEKAMNRGQPARTENKWEKDARDRTKRDKAKRVAELAVRMPTVAALVAGAEKFAFTDEVLRLIGRSLTRASTTDDVVKRRGLTAKQYQGDKAIKALIAESKGAALRGLLVELVVVGDAYYGSSTVLDEACVLYKIDQKAIAKKASAGLAAAKVAKKPATSGMPKRDAEAVKRAKGELAKKKARK